MAEEEEEVEDDGKTMALPKGGVTDLARTTGRTSLVREARGTSLVRATCAAMQASLLCRLHGHSPCRCARGVGRDVHLSRP